MEGFSMSKVRTTDKHLTPGSKRIIHGDSTGATYLTPEQWAEMLGVDVATATAPTLVISPVPRMPSKISHTASREPTPSSSHKLKKRLGIPFQGLDFWASP
jgi:hypothetical protein